MTGWKEYVLPAIWRAGIVLLALSVLLGLSLIPLEVAHLGDIRPFFMLAAIYYWAIMRPSMIPAALVFLLGLLLDLLYAYPLGMQALVLVTAYWVARGQRRFLMGQSFRVIWATFSVVALASGLIQWTAFSIFSLSLAPLQPPLVSSLLTALIFPLLVMPLSLVVRALSDTTVDSL